MLSACGALFTTAKTPSGRGDRHQTLRSHVKQEHRWTTQLVRMYTHTHHHASPVHRWNFYRALIEPNPPCCSTTRKRQPTRNKTKLKIATDATTPKTDNKRDEDKKNSDHNHTHKHHGQQQNTHFLISPEKRTGAVSCHAMPRIVV